MRPLEAAKYLRLSTSTLAKMRIKGNGPPYTKTGAKLVLYNKLKLDHWLESRSRTSTSQFF
ncbi:helix-turn-helix domain-containing protein [Oceanicaulis sp. AH-315-P02]|nr:helix-turn-helix domain-containing protein [Oceanicaulis sp. AH-315-P02]